MPDKTRDSERGGISLPSHPATTFGSNNSSSSSDKNTATTAEKSSTTTTTPQTDRFSQNMPKVDNPLPHVLPEGENAAPLEVIGSTASDKLVIIMVGLPATGKTHIAKRICRFLSFFHDIPSQIFNVGDYRRQLCGAQQPAAFYDANNTQGQAARNMACDAALADLMEYITQDGGVRVAAFDATNSSFARRQYILESLSKANIRVKKMFVESVCDQDELLEENIRKVKLSTPDYKDMDPEEAVLDFKQRRANYEAQYEPLSEADGPFVKIINSKQFIVHNIRGYLPLKVVHFVMNLHTLPRTFYLTRHGQSEYNLKGKIGGDSGLTPAGIEYARRLAQFAKEYMARVDDDDENVDENHNDDKNENDVDTEETKQEATTTAAATTQPTIQQRPCRLWTSTLRRTKETAQFIAHDKFEYTFDNGDTGEWVQFRPMPRRNLDELYAGVCDGMTYQEISQVFPEEFERRQQDKLAYRYPRGESYMDVTLRLEPLAQEMERTREPVLVVGHQGILRILYAYFMGLDRKEAPYVSIPLNNVIELTPHAYGCHEKRYCLMNKEEMLNDGQDEPVTSMPLLSTTSAMATAANGSSSSTAATNDPPRKPPTLEKQASVGRESFVENVNTHYAPTDPIMNAPSC